MLHKEEISDHEAIKLDHIKWMLENFPKPSDISLVDGKYDRWLGFMQGALWAMDFETIDQMRDDVREGRGLEAVEELMACTWWYVKCIDESTKGDV